jgi:hypothetical protein
VLVTGFPPRRPRFDLKSGDVEFVVDKWWVFSEIFGFPYKFSVHLLLHTHQASSSSSSSSSSGAAGDRPNSDCVPNGFSLTQPYE